MKCVEKKGSACLRWFASPDALPTCLWFPASAHSLTPLMQEGKCSVDTWGCRLTHQHLTGTGYVTTAAPVDISQSSLMYTHASGVGRVLKQREHFYIHFHYVFCSSLIVLIPELVVVTLSIGTSFCKCHVPPQATGHILGTLQFLWCITYRNAIL